MRATRFLNPDAVHPSWRPLIDDDFLNDLESIEGRLGTRTTPPDDRVLRFLRLDLEAVQVVILGQDPYPQPGAATGRAFEPGTLDSWLDPFPNPSIGNILKALYRTRKGGAPDLATVREAIAAGEFAILPPRELFDHWEAQGVLLLNTAFTTRLGTSGAHHSLWKPLTERIVGFIVERNASATWFLWGGQAQKWRSRLDGASVCECPHPVAMASGAGRFEACGCFRETMGVVDWVGE
jgi:uracil-DNA glycosylase